MPTLGKNVEYALHSLVYFVGNPAGSSITIKALSKFQNISESYLAKTFTKLKKSGIVKSNVGVKGGYSLAKQAGQITFLDVVMAVEGELSLFECNGIRDNCVLFGQEERPWKRGDLCTIHKVMMEVENEIKAALKSKTLQWLYDTIAKNADRKFVDDTKSWFDKNVFNFE